MSINQHRFCPKDFQIEGNSINGDVFLHFLEELGVSATTIELTQEQLHKFLVALAQCIATSPVQETKALGQLFAVRSISAHHKLGSMVTLKYETEIGITLETSIDRAEAEELSKQLAAALKATEGHIPISH